MPGAWRGATADSLIAVPIPANTSSIHRTSPKPLGATPGKEPDMSTNDTPATPYLAKWSCAIRGGASLDYAVTRTATWAKATMDNWALGGLADDVGLIAAEFSSNAWTHGSPPVMVTLLLHGSVLTIEVSDAGAGLAVFAGPRPLGAGGRGLPAAVDIAQQIGIDGGAWGTRMWARLHFHGLPRPSPGPRPPEPGAAPGSEGPSSRWRQR